MKRPPDLDLADARQHEIVPRLWQGGYLWRDRTGAIREDDRVEGHWDLIVTLDDLAPPPPVWVGHHAVLIPDGELDPGDVVRVEDAARAAAEAWTAGGQVLIRCQAGYNRSGLVTARTLVILGYEVEAAIDLIRAKRSRFALFNTYFLAYLRGAQ